MGNILSDLKERSLRKRIDGINFTSTKPFESLLQCDSGLMASEQFAIVKDVAVKILNILRIDYRFTNYDSAKLIMDLNEERGIYIEIFFKKIDLYVVVQFKGFFFIKEHALPSCRVLILAMIEQLGSIFRVSTIDLAQDFLVPVDGLLPIPNSNSFKFRYCFKHRSRVFYDNESSGNIFTGFVLSSSRYEVKIYDKIRETQKAKNQEKKMYYKSLYDEYKETGVTRIELRLRQELCREIFDYFIDLKIPEDELISLCLKKFHSKHKLRVRLKGSSDEDWRRWPVHPHWEFIFSPESKINFERKTSGDFLYTSPDKDLHKSLFQVAEKVALANPSITEDELREMLSKVDLKDILPKTKLKLKRREESLVHFEKMKTEILQKYETPLIQGNRALGISITSPVERKPIEELNT